MKENKITKRVLYYIINHILYIFGFILLLVVYKCSSHYYNKIPRNNIKEVIGVVTKYEFGGKGSRHSVLSFQLNTKVYESNSWSSLVLGEKFIIEYEENNPSVNSTRLDKPVFLKEEKIDTVIGKVTKYKRWFSDRISFYYYVNNEIYEQEYKVSENSKEKYPNLKEDNLYKVIYWKDDPRRSIVLFDKPLSLRDMKSNNLKP